MNSTLALISGLGLETSGLGLETPGLVNIPVQHNMAFTPADHLVPVQRSYSRRSGHNEMYQ